MNERHPKSIKICTLLDKPARRKINIKADYVGFTVPDEFVVGYESGMTMMEIAKRNNVSERTIYRYKAYYDKMKEAEDNK